MWSGVSLNHFNRLINALAAVRTTTGIPQQTFLSWNVRKTGVPGCSRSEIVTWRFKVQFKNEQACEYRMCLWRL